MQTNTSLDHAGSRESGAGAQAAQGKPEHADYDSSTSDADVGLRSTSKTQKPLRPLKRPLEEVAEAGRELVKAGLPAATKTATAAETAGLVADSGMSSAREWPFR